MYQGLESFCRRVSMEDPESDRSVYLRIRMGKSPRHAPLMSKVEATGRDAGELHEEITEKVNNLGNSEIVWIEAMERGKTNPTETFKIAVNEDENPKTDALSTMSNALVSMSRDVMAMATEANYRVGQQQDRMVTLTEAVFNERLAKQKIELEASNNGGMAQALQMAAPIALSAVGALANRQKHAQLAQTPPEAAQEPVQVETEQALDQCIDFMVEAVKADPDLITEERMEKMSPMVMQALGLNNP